MPVSFRDLFIVYTLNFSKLNKGLQPYSPVSSEMFQTHLHLFFAALLELIQEQFKTLLMLGELKPNRLFWRNKFAHYLKGGLRTFYELY